jgi:hypothetical protein
MRKKPTGPEPATMIVDRYDPVNLFELIPKLDLEFEPELAHLDRLLDDDELFNLVKADLLKRYPNSGRLGRHSTPVEVVLRMLVVKRLYNFSYEQRRTVASCAGSAYRPPRSSLASSRSTRRSHHPPQAREAQGVRTQDSTRRGRRGHHQSLRGSPGERLGALRLSASLKAHQQRFWRAPYLLAGDRGLYSVENERLAYQAGMEGVGRWSRRARIQDATLRAQ